MTKKSRRKSKYLENGKSFWAFLSILKEYQWSKEGESPAFSFQHKFIMNKININFISLINITNKINLIKMRY